MFIGRKVAHQPSSPRVRGGTAASVPATSPAASVAPHPTLMAPWQWTSSTASCARDRQLVTSCCSHRELTIGWVIFLDVNRWANMNQNTFTRCKVIKQIGGLWLENSQDPFFVSRFLLPRSDLVTTLRIQHPRKTSNMPKFFNQKQALGVYICNIYIYICVCVIVYVYISIFLLQSNTEGTVYCDYGTTKSILRYLVQATAPNGKATGSCSSRTVCMEDYIENK